MSILQPFCGARQRAQTHFGAYKKVRLASEPDFFVVRGAQILLEKVQILGSGASTEKYLCMLFYQPHVAAPLLLRPMSTLHFKTTINCANCVRAITPALNGEPAIQAWEVDTTGPDKLLTVRTDLAAAQVEALVKEAGFQAQAI